MATLEVVPSGYTGSTNITTSSSYPISNGYTDTDSTTYARFTLSSGSTGYLYYTFDCSDIPSTATISSITARAKARVSSTSRVTSTQCQLFTGTTAKGSNVTFASTSSTNIVTLSPGSSWTRSELDDLRLKIGGTGSSGSGGGSSRYIYFYGAEVVVTYVTESRTVTVTLSGDGTVSPSGSNTAYDGDDFTVTITPTNISTATVTATNNGTDVTSELVAHGAGDTVSATPESVTTSSIQSGSEYASYAVGHSAENPYSSTSNMYAASGSTGYAEYSFDFSDIPSGATIEEVSVVVAGHRENATIDSTHVSQVQLYSGTTTKGDAEDFTSTSAQTITVSDPGTWTQAELQSAKLRHTVGYYGGLVTGVTWTVTYSTGTGITHYTYTYTVSGNATIAVVISGSGTVYLWAKDDTSTWNRYGRAWKKISGTWTEQSDLTNVYQSGVNYRHGD